MLILFFLQEIDISIYFLLKNTRFLVFNAYFPCILDLYLYLMFVEFYV